MFRLYYHTLRHLKPTQVAYQLYYRLWRQPADYPIVKQANKALKPLSLQPSIPSAVSYAPKLSFTFLNLPHSFAEQIDWNYKGFGKLWTYNLNYFEYLLQEDLSREEGLELIHDFIQQQDLILDGREPFPTSLRIINWIKFLSYHQVSEGIIDQSLRGQLIGLSKRLEYHLLGNHLLENAFALFFGACYCQHPQIKQRAMRLLQQELKEQTLPDGGHFERSPMYHQLILYRLLDALNLINQSPGIVPDDFHRMLRQVAEKMLGWLVEITFSNGTVPAVNDSAPEIAPSSTQLQEYARRLKLQAAPTVLKESGYRKYSTSNYELFIDVGAIGPDYIPGHAHSDTLSFVLHSKRGPVIVDTGISTYEKNERRQQERRTAAHNTVQINGAEQSEVWGGFRVGRRATVAIQEESSQQIKASHDGYAPLKANHQRTFITQPKTVEIIDQVKGAEQAQAFLHFHPSIRPSVNDNRLEGAFGSIELQGADRIQLEACEIAQGFNQRQPSLKATIQFKENLHTIIQCQ